MVRKDLGLPLFIELAQRHLEKEARPVPNQKEFNVPVDLVQLACGDSGLTSTIEELILVYQPKS